MTLLSKKFLFTFLLSALIIPQLAFAGSPIDLNKPALNQIADSVTNTGTNAKLNATSPEIIVGRFIYAFLSLVGVILVVIVVYAGFLWMTAGGNEDQVGHAKALLKNAIIGIIIALTAYGITSYVIGSIIVATGT